MEFSNVFRTNQNVSFEQICEDLLSRPAMFFSDLQEVFKTNSLYADSAEELAFLSKGQELFYIKILKPGYVTSVDEVLDSYLEFEKRWEKHTARSDVSGGASEKSRQFIIVSERFDSHFTKKISFIQKMPVQLIEIRAIQDATGNASYLIDIIFSNQMDAQQPEKKEMLLSEPEVPKILHEEKTQMMPKLESEELHELSAALQIDEEKGNNKENVSEVMQDADFFQRGQLSLDEEKDFDHLNQKLLIKEGDG